MQDCHQVFLDICARRVLQACSIDKVTMVPYCKRVYIKLLWIQVCFLLIYVQMRSYPEGI